jgi:hypothetical protein
MLLALNTYLLAPQTQPQPTPSPVIIYQQSGGGGGSAGKKYDIIESFPLYANRKASRHYQSRPFHYAQNNPKSEEDIAKNFRTTKERVRTKVVHVPIHVPVFQKQDPPMPGYKKDNKKVVMVGIGIGTLLFFALK